MLMMQHERAQWKRPQPKFKYIEVAYLHGFESAKKRFDEACARYDADGLYEVESEREYNGQTIRRYVRKAA